MIKYNIFGKKYVVFMQEKNKSSKLLVCFAKFSDIFLNFSRICTLKNTSVSDFHLNLWVIFDKSIIFTAFNGIVI